MDLSIIIPAFEESKKIARDIKAAASSLRPIAQGRIIVVDDGSQDRPAEAAREVHVPPSVKLNVIRYEQHRGKGYGVARA